MNLTAHGRQILQPVLASPPGLLTLSCASITKLVVISSILVLAGCSTQRKLNKVLDSAHVFIQTNTVAVAEISKAIPRIEQVLTQQVVRVVTIVETNAATVANRGKGIEKVTQSILEESKPYIIGALAAVALWIGRRYGFTPNNLKSDLQKLRKQPTKESSHVV